MPDGRKIMLLSHTLTIKGSHVASLTEFCLVIKEEIAWQTAGRMPDRKMLFSHTLTMRGSHVENLVKFRPVI